MSGPAAAAPARPGGARHRGAAGGAGGGDLLRDACDEGDRRLCPGRAHHLSLRHRRRCSPCSPSAPRSRRCAAASPSASPSASAPILWIVGGLVLQLLLLKPAGFSIATGLLFAFTARGFGRGPLWLTIPVGIVFSLAVWLVFARLLMLSLPAGPLERLFP